MIAIMEAELRALLRNTTAWGTAIALPVVFGALWIVRPPGVGDDGAAGVIVLQVAMLLVFTLHTAGTTALASRRERLVLKRWRTTPVADASILAGTIAVPAALTLLQAAALTVVTARVLESRPAFPVLLVAAVLIATLSVGALTFVAASVTRSAEHAMVTTAPLVLALIGGAIWSLVVGPGELGLPGLLLPGAAAAELLQLGWDGAPGATGGWTAAIRAAGPALGASAALVVVCLVLARVTFRWEARS